MERELWPRLYQLVREVGRDFHQKSVQIPAWVLPAVMLWAALHDRPPSWACQPKHWTGTRHRPLRLPSPSTMSRRVYGTAVGLVWKALEERLRAEGDPRLLSLLDGKPLVVGAASKDPDAAYGATTGGRPARGYRLHVLWGGRSMPEAWDVTPLNVAEKTVARDLVKQAARGGYLLADAGYDANPLFDGAAEAGYQLLTPMPHPNAGRGHHYQSPFRLRCIELMRSLFGQALHRYRTQIERLFGNATAFAGGLGPLPAWIRRDHRVRTWVWAKLLINAVRMGRRQRLAERRQRLAA